jgi:hypothetical protein
MYLFSNERFGIIFKPINPHILSSKCVNSPIISAWSKSFFFLFFFLFGRIMQVLMWRQHKQTKMNKIKKNKFNNNLRAGAHDFYSSDRESSSRPIRKLLSLSPIDLNSHTPFLLSQNDICYHWPVRVDFPPFSLQIPP